MSGRRSDEDLDRLLARGRLSGKAREDILENVLESAVPRRRWWPSRPWLGVAGVAVAGALGVVILVARPKTDAFTVKGPSGASASPRLEVACIDGSALRCPRGSTLVFRVEDATGGGFLAAFAERDGAAANQRIWYFPAEDGSGPKVESKAGTQVVQRGVRIGPEHEAGRYTIHMLLGKAPVTRETAMNPKSPDILAHATSSVEVTP